MTLSRLWFKTFTTQLPFQTSPTQTLISLHNLSTEESETFPAIALTATQKCQILSSTSTTLKLHQFQPFDRYMYVCSRHTNFRASLSGAIKTVHMSTSSETYGKRPEWKSPALKFLDLFMGHISSLSPPNQPYSRAESINKKKRLVVDCLWESDCIKRGIYWAIYIIQGYCNCQQFFIKIWGN